MGQHVLILGGHGKVAQILTRQLLKNSWIVTSVIRAQEQFHQIESLASGQQRLNVLVRSLEDIKSVAQAKNILEEVKPDAVVWSAGAGGKGGLDRVSNTCLANCRLPLTFGLYLCYRSRCCDQLYQCSSSDKFYQKVHSHIISGLPP